MAILDRLFGNTKRVQRLEKQVKQLAQQNLQVLINANTAIFPSWEVIQEINSYTTSDDVYAIISYLAETAARVPLYPYQVIDESSLKSYKKFGQQTLQGRYFQTKALQDLSDKDKFSQFIEGITYSDRVEYFSLLYITGELFLWKEVIELGPNAGKIILHTLKSQNVTLVISDSFPQRVIRYDYIDQGGTFKFLPEEIIHVKFFNPTITNGQQWRGLSPLQVLSKRLTRMDAAMDAATAQMQNGGVPGIVYEKADFAIEALGQRKNDFAQYLRNASNKGAPYFAAGEMGYVELGLSLADLDVAKLSQIDFTKLCNAYKFPEILLNNQQAATYDNMNTALKMLYTNSILPNLYLFRDAILESILPHFNDRIKRTIEIDISEIPALQDDMAKQAEALNAMWWITPNEKRSIQQFEEINIPGMNQIIIDSGKQFLIDLGVNVQDLIVYEEQQHR
jgi:HK97 family phage portal protein